MHTVWACLATDRRPVQGLSLLLSYDSCNMLHTHPPTQTHPDLQKWRKMDGWNENMNKLSVHELHLYNNKNGILLSFYISTG